MTKMQVQSKDKLFMLAINKGITSRTRLFAELELKNGSFQRIYDRLKKLGFVERIKRNIYALTTKGKSFITTELEPNPDVAFGTKSFQDYLEQFPEVFQAVLRLTLCSIVSKRTRIFDKFKSGYPGIILAGDPKIGKTPLGEIVCELLGLDPVAHKLDTQLVTTGEIKGRSRGRAGFDPSPWFTKVISILDEIDKILSASTSEVAKFLAHSDKFYIREEKPYLHRAVPFLTMNVQADTRGVVAKIREILGVEYIKRNAVVNVNPIKPYLGSPYLFFRKVCKNYPRISYRVPILRDEITDQEAELIADLMGKAIKPDPDDKYEAYYDERGIEIQSLAHYSLSGGENMKSSIYSVCRDRLLCLETLEAVEPDWRESFYDEWREHTAGRNPDLEAKIRKAQIERAKLEDELKDKEDKIQDEKDKDQDSVQVFNEKYSKVLGIFEDWIKGLRRHDYNTKADALQKERTEYRKGKWTKERLDQMMRRMVRIKDNIMLPIERDLRDKKEKKEEKNRQNKINDEVYKEERRTAVFGIETLITDLWKGEEWQAAQSAIQTDTTKKIYKDKVVLGDTKGREGERRIRAIRELREASKKLRSHLATVVKSKGSKSLPLLEQELQEAKYKSGPWLNKYERAIKSGWDELFGGKKTEESTPEGGGLPPETVDFKGKDSEELLERFGYGASESEQPKVRRGKTLFEKWREAHRKKKGEGEEPKSRGFMGRSEEDL